MAMTKEDMDVLFDLDFPPSCMGKNHHVGLKGHNPQQPASWMIQCPDGHPAILVCDARRQFLASSVDVVTCDTCGRWYPPGPNSRRI